MQSKVFSCFHVPAYRQVDSEEGPYEALCGWNVVATTDDGGGWSSQYVLSHGPLVEPPAFNLPRLFDTQEQAERLVERVLAAKEIDGTKWFKNGPASHADQLPDYVTNWWRPEYN